MTWGGIELDRKQVRCALNFQIDSDKYFGVISKNKNEYYIDNIHIHWTNTIDP